MAHQREKNPPQFQPHSTLVKESAVVQEEEVVVDPLKGSHLVLDIPQKVNMVQ